MLEPVRCPSCSSRFGLGPQRVKPGIRRARCFRCKALFGIESEVQRLLKALPAPPPLEPAFESMDFPDLEPLVLEPLVLEPLAETPFPESTLLEEETVLEEVDEVEEITASATLPPLDSPPSLTLGDLEGTEEEILEKTLVLNPPPEAAPVIPPTQYDLPGTATGSYASAKDAISRLLGEAPRPEPQPRPRTGTANQMDVEAALDALDSTLGGASAKDLGTKPVVQPAQFRVEAPAPKPEPPTLTLSSTVKLSHEELMAAMAAAAMPAAAEPAQPTVQIAVPTAVVPPPASPAPPPPAVQATPAPLPPVPLPPSPARPTAPPVVPGAEPKTADQGLYKVQLPKETLNNVTLDVLTTWIEQGRVQEYHMVARQQSEHWIEAGKVPALRMVFDRIKRAQASLVQQSTATLVPPPVPEAAPAKKSLFGGLFNRG